MKGALTWQPVLDPVCWGSRPCLAAKASVSAAAPGSDGSRDVGRSGLLLAQLLEEKHQVSFEAACIAAGALLHLPQFFKGKIIGADALQSPGVGLLQLQDTPMCIKYHRACSTWLLGRLAPLQRPSLAREELQKLESTSLFLLCHRSQSLLRFRNN